MEFVFMPPFSQHVGERLKIALKVSSPLRMLIPKLPPEILAVDSGEIKIEDDTLGAHIIFFRQNRLLKIDDLVACDDIIKVMLPVTGG